MVFLAENGSLLSYQGQMLFQDRLITAEVYQPIVTAIQNSPFANSDRILLSGIDKAFVFRSRGRVFLSGYFTILSKG